MTAFFNKKKSIPKKDIEKPAGTSLKETGAVAVKAERAVMTQDRGIDLSMVLIRPHVTEKATDLSGRGVYAFEVNKLANKMHIRQAVVKQYKVKPVKVAIVNGKPKLMKNPRTGRVQTKKTSIKKALVYLKKGDKIEFV